MWFLALFKSLCVKKLGTTSSQGNKQFSVVHVVFGMTSKFVCKKTGNN